MGRLAMLLVFLATGSAAGANMLPEAVLVIHVQPGAGGPLTCGNPPPVLACSELTTLTDATGTLVFDLLIYPTLEHYHPGSRLWLQDVELTLTWPETWELERWTRCSGATGILRDAADTAGATLELHWSLPPEFSNELLPIARLEMSAPIAGDLEAQGYATMSLDDIQEPFGAYLGTRARAGVECGDCAASCSGHSACWPRLFAPALTLHVPFRSTAETSFDVEIASGAGPSGCAASPLEVASTLEWLHFGIEELEWPNWRVRIQADAASVPAGSYETWVRCHTVCASCLALTVIVDEDPRPAEQTSWGAMKALFGDDR